MAAILERRHLGAVIVAASDAPANWKLVADYQCDGTADQVEVAAAVVASGGTNSVQLSPGNFNYNATPATITYPNWSLNGVPGLTNIQVGTNIIIPITLAPATTNMANITLVSGIRVVGSGGYGAIGIKIQGAPPGITLRDIAFQSILTGLENEGGQFCLFDNVRAYSCDVGFYEHQHATNGGGNNNTWETCIAQGCNVGLIAIRDSSPGNYPMHSNTFTNFSSHDNTTCGVYLDGVNDFLFQTPAHENNGLSGAASITRFAKTIKKSTWHFYNSRVKADTCQITTGSPNPNYVFDASSRVTFTDTAGTSMYTNCDEDSKLYFEGHHDMYGTITNIVKWPYAQAALNPVVLLGEPHRTVSTMPNTCPYPRSLNVFAGMLGAGATAGTDTDPVFGQISYVQFAPSVSDSSTNYASWYTNTGNANYTVVGHCAATSFLIRADRDCSIGMVAYGGSITLPTAFPLKANHVYLCSLIVTLKTTPVASAMAIFPRDTTGPKVNAWDCHSIFTTTSPDPSQHPIISSFVGEGWFNPGLQAYTVTNPNTDRALNVTGDTLPQVAEVLGTVIADLQARGVLG